MDTSSVRCNHCGAPLQVAEHTRFVTCQFCQSSLEVKRTDSSIFTEEVAKIAAHTGKMAESLEVIQLQNEIARLDREQAEKSPNARAAGGGGVVFLLMFTGFGLFTAFNSAHDGAPWIFQVLGAGAALIGIICLARLIMEGVSGTAEAASHAQDRRRAELDLRLKKLTKG